MMNTCKLVCMVLALGAMAVSASAEIAVSVYPDSTVIDLNNPMPPYYVDIVADISAADAIVGWGLDLNLATPGVANWSLVAVGSAWSGVASPDGDGLAGLAFPSAVSGDDVLLARVEVFPLGLGVTGIAPGVTLNDLTEGFVKLGGASVPASFTGGSVEVVPEPATLTLLALAGLVVLRRR